MSQGKQQKAKGNDEEESGMEVVSAPDLPGGGSSNVVDGDHHQGREIIAIVPLENGAFCTIFSENFHKF
jgi:hypothetical protein